MASMQAAPSGQRGASSQAPQGGGDLTEVQGQEEYYDQADRLLAGLIDISKIKRFKNSTTAVLHADDYANRCVAATTPRQLAHAGPPAQASWPWSLHRCLFPHLSQHGHYVR